MNVSKFSPLYGAPIWDECTGGDFDEDWRLMNCLNFVYRPEGFQSRAEMDELYNWHVRRFYDSRSYRHRFARRLWSHRWSLWHLVRNLPRVIQAARYFGARQSALAESAQGFTAHPRQPRGLTPFLSPELRIDAIAALAPRPMSRRVIPGREAIMPANA